MDQLSSNLDALAIVLTDDEMSKLDELSKPTLNFPHDFVNAVNAPIQNGTTINGRPGDAWGGGPKNDAERW